MHRINVRYLCFVVNMCTHNVVEAHICVMAVTKQRSKIEK